MGTFHHNKSELHGITVVVETASGDLYIGRCDDMDDDRVLLLDADMHREDENGPTRAEYLERAEQFGVWKKYERLAIPRSRVTAVRRLGDTDAPSGS